MPKITLPTPKSKGAVKSTLSLVAGIAQLADGEVKMLKATSYLDNVAELVNDYGLTAQQAQAILS